MAEWSYYYTTTSAQDLVFYVTSNNQMHLVTSSAQSIQFAPAASKQPEVQPPLQFE